MARVIEDRDVPPPVEDRDVPPPVEDRDVPPPAPPPEDRDVVPPTPPPEDRVVPPMPVPEPPPTPPPPKEPVVIPDVVIPKEAKKVEVTAEGRPAVYEHKGERYYASASTMHRMGFRTHSEYIAAQRMGVSHGPHSGTLVPSGGVIITYKGTQYRVSPSDIGKPGMSQAVLTQLGKEAYTVPITKVDVRGHSHEVFITAEQAKKLSGLEGRKQFEGRIKLGLIPKGSEYIQREEGRWAFRLPEKEIEKVVATKEIPDTHPLRKYMEFGELNVAAALKAGYRDISDYDGFYITKAKLEKAIRLTQPRDVAIRPPLKPEEEKPFHLLTRDERIATARRRFNKLVEPFKKYGVDVAKQWEEDLEKQPMTLTALLDVYKRGFDEMTGKPQKQYFDNLLVFNAQVDPYNKEIEKLNKVVEQLELEAKGLPYDLIDNYNKHTETLNELAASLEIEAPVILVGDFSLEAIDTYNTQVDKYNRKVDRFLQERTKLVERFPDIEKAVKLVESHNAKVNQLNLVVSELKPPVEPQEPAPHLGNLARMAYEGTKAEYKEATSGEQPLLKKVGNVLALTAELFVPFVWQAKNWETSSRAEKGINLAIDLLIMIPVVRLAVGGARVAIGGAAKTAIQQVVKQEVKLLNETVKALKTVYGNKSVTALKDTAKAQTVYLKEVIKLGELQRKGKLFASQTLKVNTAEARLRAAASVFTNEISKPKFWKSRPGLPKKFVGKVGFDEPKLSGQFKDFTENLIMHTKEVAETFVGIRKSPKLPNIAKLEKAVRNAKENLRIAGLLPNTTHKELLRLREKYFAAISRLGRGTMETTTNLHRELIGVRGQIKAFSQVNPVNPIEKVKWGQVIAELQAREARLQKSIMAGLRLSFVEYGITPRLAKDLVKMNRDLIKLRSEFKLLEKQLAKLEARERNLAKEIKAGLAESKQTEIKSLLLKRLKLGTEITGLESRLRYALKYLPDHIHPLAKEVVYGIPIHTKTLVRPPKIDTIMATATGRRVTLSKVVATTGSGTGVGVREATRVLAATITRAIGRPLSDIEVRAITKGLTTPEIIREVEAAALKAIQEAQRLKTRVVPGEKPLTSREVAARIRDMLREETERLAKLAPATKASEMLKAKIAPIIKTITKTVLKPPIKPIPIRPIPKKPLLIPLTRLQTQSLTSQPIPQGSIAWAQGKRKGIRGIMVSQWYFIPPPFDQLKPISLSASPLGARDADSIKPYETIQIIGRARIGVPHRVDVDLGWADIYILNGRKIVFKSGGEKTNIGTRIASPTVGMDIEEGDIIDEIPAVSRVEMRKRKPPRKKKGLTHYEYMTTLKGFRP